MAEEGSTRWQGESKRLNRIMLVPLGWIVCTALIPDFVMSVSGHRFPLAVAITSGIGILMLCVLASYLVYRARSVRMLPLVVLSGAILVTSSQCYHIAQNLGLTDSRAWRAHRVVLHATDNLVAGIGIVLVAFAFLRTIIEMLAARERSTYEHARLQDEMARRARVEKEILDTKQRYEDLVNHLPVAVYRNTPGPEGCFLEMNPAHVAMFEAESKEDFAVGGVSRLYRDAAQRQAFSEKLLRDGFVRNQELALQTVKGRPIWGEVSAVVRRDDLGHVYFDGIILDVTERKLAEDTYRTILSTAMDGFWVVDMQGRIVDVNDAYCQIIGYSREELLRMSVPDVEASESPKEVDAHIAKVAQCRRDRFETRQRRKDGRVIDVEVSITHYVDARGGRQYVFLRDITARKRSEEALRQSEAKYRDLVQNANTMILRLDTNGRVAFINEFAQEYFGFTGEDLLGRNVLGTVIPGSSGEGHDLAALLASGREHPQRSVESEYEHVMPDGRRAWIAWTSTPVYAHDGTIAEILCVANDVTERVEAERLIVEQRAQMIHASRLSALGTMASGIAHEINNPLAIISVASEQLDSLLASERPDPERIAKATASIGRNVGRIYRIVRGLKMLSRDGTMDPFVRAPVHTVVAETVELCKGRMASQGVALEVADLPESLEIECRSAQLSQALLNLLNNAHDAVENLPEKWVRIDVTDEGETVAIAVTDSGGGLAPEVRERMLVPFFTTKDPGKGVGLGLSLTKRFLEAHHGELQFDESSPHTRFVMRVPKEQTPV